MTAKSHWERVYSTKRPDEVSWFEPEPSLSLNLIELAAPNRDASIIDIGGGASQLVDGLLAKGYDRVTVLDLSPSALFAAQSRLGNAAHLVDWREDNVLIADFRAGSVDV